eukprot:359436-Chlamydomonas_euryale.AAC.4
MSTYLMRLREQGWNLEPTIRRIRECGANLDPQVQGVNGHRRVEGRFTQFTGCKYSPPTTDVPPNSSANIKRSPEKRKCIPPACSPIVHTLQHSD